MKLRARVAWATLLETGWLDVNLDLLFQLRPSLLAWVQCKQPLDSLLTSWSLVPHLVPLPAGLEGWRVVMMTAVLLAVLLRSETSYYYFLLLILLLHLQQAVQLHRAAGWWERWIPPAVGLSSNHIQGKKKGGGGESSRLSLILQSFCWTLDQTTFKCQKLSNC